jgi:hypothetical protein
MILDDRYPWAVVLDPNGDETGMIVPWAGLEATLKAYQIDGYALKADSEPGVILCDFRRLPGRVWTSRYDQEIRIFQVDDEMWQYSFAGMDISDGAYYYDAADARLHAQYVDEFTSGPWSTAGGYPLWADLFAIQEEEDTK